MEDSAPKFYVYLHFTPLGDVFYVGKGGGGKRVRSHDFRNNRNRHYKNVVAKYGEENIEALVFFRDTEEEALRTEVEWIHALRQEGLRLTNITAGGDGVSGLTFGEESIQKMSKAAKQRGGGFRKGHNPSAATRAKMAASAVGDRNAAGNKGIAGRTVPPEVVKKRAAKLRGRKRSGEALENIRAGQRRRRARERKEKEDGR